MWRTRTFPHGIHPPGHKERTAGQKIRRLPFADFYSILLSQHTGNPARPVVRKGQELERGQIIAEADGFLSVPMHSPVAGQVLDVGLVPTLSGEMKEAIRIKAWPGALQILPGQHEQDALELSRSEILQRIQGSGMVGLGGAAFPTHVKFSPPAEKKIQTLIINGCECEPYLTADHRIMLEWTDLVLQGAAIALKATEAGEAIIAIEDNKLDAVQALQSALQKAQQLALQRDREQHSDYLSKIRVEVVQTKYPQGAEKMLARSLLGLEIPSGQLPADVGLMVSNVTTLAELALLIPQGLGLVERVITITGDGIAEPGNYIVPIGTPLEFLLAQVGLKENCTGIIVGGPMMGLSVSNLFTPITKAVSGIVALAETERQPDVEIKPCIKCSFCLQACPLFLNPSRMGLLARKDRFEEMANDYHLFDCFECGSCSYVCPSKIPLVQLFRMAKKSLRKARAAEAKAGST